MKQTAFIKLKKIPITFSSHLAEPVFHPNDPNSIIISTESSDITATPGIYKYNLETNEIDLIHAYHNTFIPEEHTQIIHPYTKELYVFGGYNRSFGAFNLDNHPITYNGHNDDNVSDLSICSHWPYICYIPSPINQIHSWHECQHAVFTVDVNGTNQIKISKHQSFGVEDIFFSKILYNPLNKKLQLFGCQDMNIIMDYDVFHGVNAEWKVNKLTMPYDVDHTNYHILLGFDSILFVFYLDRSDDASIWCLDVKHEQWFECNDEFPKCIASNLMVRVVQKDYNAHIMDFEDNYHFKVCLFDLIPHKLNKLWMKDYKPLIMGYCREKQCNNDIPEIPHVLKQLILNYFPLFV